MFADRVRGGAGVVFAIMAVLLLRGGSGFAESAASPGCKDDATCYAETREEGVVGPEGFFVTSHTATCKGECVPGQTCTPNSVQNPDGTTTIQCSCDPNANSPSCSGFATVDSAGRVQSFSCVGGCQTGACRKRTLNVQTDRNCPTGYSLNRQCVCE